ncbi:hypothetical protein GWI33_012084 [Rhynchophorus ferrugineus]|uniref:Uncharacterized protein n=1 Tax=Rhynchophorus ferrugineus TaxID=354439 RepID=A0A834MCS2_RHYFE|nr:hypothetical protein GWI33_012084 [Rhynchophorus ferrugineus]
MVPRQAPIKLSNFSPGSLFLLAIVEDMPTRVSLARRSRHVRHGRAQDVVLLSPTNRKKPQKAEEEEDDEGDGEEDAETYVFDGAQQALGKGSSRMVPSRRSPIDARPRFLWEPDVCATMPRQPTLERSNGKGLEGDNWPGPIGARCFAP